MTRLSRPLLALATSTLLVAACGSSSNDASVEIQPIEPILASEISINTDPSGTAATFEVDTTIPGGLLGDLRH